ncbi:MAG TPA: hypothetical protein VFQ91_15180 [Bryobacteraceae bacterium]|nr:hypothetical protein [Bryobacteraceae bacterium]
MSSLLKRVIFWDFPRASWQYDVIVVGVLAFIFLTPREIFRDQPKAQSIVLLPNETPGVELFYVDPKLLESIPEADRFQKVSQMLERRDGKRLQLYRLTPISDAENEITGFMAYTKLVK